MYCGRLPVAPDDDGVWPWQDTYLVVGALIFTADCAAAFLGLGKELTVLDGGCKSASTDFYMCGPRTPRTELWCRIASSLFVARARDRQQPNQSHSRRAS